MDKDTVTVTLSIAAFVVSIATLLIALSQMKIASAKARLDLYNKRFNIYVAALDYYQAIWGKSKTPVDECATHFIKAYRESQFLFKSKDGVYDTLTKIKDAGAAVTGLEKMVADIEADMVGDKIVAGQLRQKRMERLDGFEKALMTLEKQLSTYIRFEHASGWHPFK
ncbi:TPA: hypothetical protein UL936_001929 [Stenotrophomonas maltophilia]|nr:hypothetical protein [Stenotrophomonas maltophilia]